MNRITRIALAATALALVPTGLASAHGGGHGDGEYDPQGESDPCAWAPVEEASGGAVDFEEHEDKESGRRECEAFDHPTEEDTWGSWDPATSDDDPNYSPGDRGQRWAMSKEDERPEEGQTDATGAMVHYGYHNPKCSQDAQDILLDEMRRSLARYDGAEGFLRATQEGYTLYPIGGKVWHAYNTGLYDDTDENGVQRDNDPWFPENIIYAMTDDGWKAMGAMFTMAHAEQHLDENGNPMLWKDVDPTLWPQWTSKVATIDPVTGEERFETCQMNWHTHGGLGGTATGGGADPNTAESHPMSHVWAWGMDMWERGADGSEANAWWAPYRAVPVICSEYDACI